MAPAPPRSGCLTPFLVGLALSLGVAGAAAAVGHGGVAEGDPQPEVVAYHAARIHTGDGLVVEDACLIVEDGKVVDVVRRDELPPLMPVVELGESVLAPGFVAVDSTLTGAVDRGDRSIGALRRAFDDWDPFADPNEVLAHGITTVYLSPARGRLVGGRGAVVKVAGERRVLKEEADLRVDLTSAALHPPDYFRPPIPPTSENPILPAEVQPPNTLAGAVLALREALAEARDRGLDAADPNVVGLAEWLGAGGPVRFVARDEEEYAAAAALAAEFGLEWFVDGLDRTEADFSPATDAPPPLGVVLAVPVPASPSDSFAARERVRHPYLEGATGPIAVRPDGGSWTWLLEAVGVAVRRGLAPEMATAAITRAPAAFLGVDDRVGVLLPGRDADFVVLSDDPGSPAAHVLQVFVEGERVWDTDLLTMALDPDDPARDLAEAVLVRAGTLWPGDGPPLTGGVEVLMRGGRIVEVGHHLAAPPGTRVFDAGPEAHLAPGFVDARSTFAVGGVSDPRADLARFAAGSLTSRSWLPLARAGVTTIVAAPGRWSLGGSRAAFLKTAAVGADDAALDERSVVFVDLVTNDHAGLREALEKQLEKAQKYAKKWEEWRKERDEWEARQAEEQAAKRAERERALRLRLAQGSVPESAEEPAEEEGAEEEAAAPQEEEAKPVDPINGLWEGTIESEFLPEPLAVLLRLHHEGTSLTGIFSSPDDPSGETLELDGTWDPKSKTIHFELPTEVGVAVLEGVVTAPDSMDVSIELEGIGSVDFTMTRIEVEEAGAAPKRKRVEKDEGPPPPNVDWRLEGWRDLLEGRAVAVVRVARADEAEVARELLTAADVPFLFAPRAWGGDSGIEPAALAGARGAVVLQPWRVRVGLLERSPAAELLAAGMPVAFGSDAGRGSASLPDALASLARVGVGPEEALRAVTAGAADLLGVGDRIGRLRPGRDADVVVLDGPPFVLGTEVLRVFVNGRPVPTEP